MELTIIQTGAVSQALAGTFMPYPKMFEAMFDATGHDFTYDVVPVFAGAPLPDPAGLEGIVITGSAAGVYDTYSWLAPLRAFIRDAYSKKTSMLGICFGHQIMADALGGGVHKSDKGWGLGRHSYELVARPPFMADAPSQFAVACSHQDQVIVAPPEGQVILASPFTPIAGLVYENGAALSFQPHPEFSDAYADALVTLRRGVAPDAVIEAAHASFAKPSQSAAMAQGIAQFFVGR